MNESTDKPTASRVRSRASNLKQRVKQEGKEKLESGKHAAADQFEEIADAIDAAGSQLDQSQPTLANYASKLADGVGGLATRLREDSVEDIYRDVRRVATEHPGLFLLGSAALGLVIARFMKASGEQSMETATTGGGDEGLEIDVEEEVLERGQGSSGLADGSLYGSASTTGGSSGFGSGGSSGGSSSMSSGSGSLNEPDEDDLEALRPGRDSTASNPYGSPNLGA